MRIATAALAVLIAGGMTAGAVSMSADAAPKKRAVAPRAAPQSATGMTLAEAAGQPHGLGAEDVKGQGKQRKVTPAVGRDKAEADGVTVGFNGCIVGYGDGGQCLPSNPGSAVEMGHTRLEMPWTCTEVRLTFADGIRVAKKGDVLRLDYNHDGVACDAADG